MKKRGFSLIEIIIALFVASAVFSTALPLIFNTITANRSAKLKLNAYQAAQQEIENTKTQQIDTIENHTFTVAGVPGGSGTFSVIKNDPELAETSSRVSWNFRNKTEVVELKTYVYGAVE